MSKDLLVLADEYAAATATFARALALKDGADSMSPIAREAGDKRAALAEALAALDTAQPVQVNAMLMEALERMVESVTGVDQVSAVDEARAALTAAKQAQPAPVNVVAYLDIGAGGYLDLGSDLTDEQLQELPNGRHALGIIGTHGIDGYVQAIQQAQPSQADAQDAARYRWIRSTTNWASNSSNERIDVRNCPELWDAAIDAAINAKEQLNG